MIGGTRDAYSVVFTINGGPWNAYTIVFTMIRDSRDASSVVL